MTTRVKNKAAAPVQISAEQLLREAAERQLESDQAAPRSKIVDAEELAGELACGEVPRCWGAALLSTLAR